MSGQKCIIILSFFNQFVHFLCALLIDINNSYFVVRNVGQKTALYTYYITTYQSICKLTSINFHFI